MNIPRILVIGVGNRMRGDDAVGPIVADALGRRLGPQILTAVGEDAVWRLLAADESADLVLLIDAAESGEHLLPGQWRAFRRPDQIQDAFLAFLHGSHAFSIAAVLRLGQRLGTLPPSVWIYAVGGAAFGHGQPLSRSVRRALPGLARQIEQDVRCWLEKGLCTSSR